MKKLLLFGILVSTLWGQAPQSITLSAPPPSSVVNVNAQLVGNQGRETYYYWVVANYARGQATAKNVQISNVPTLSVSNYVTITWSQASGATSYDVLRTSTPTLSSSCTCAVTTGSTSNTTNDVGGALGVYTYNPVGVASVTLNLDNQNYNIPRVLMNFPVNPTTFAMLPAATSVNGQVYLIKDALAMNNCAAGGGTDTPAICWSNGTTWIAIGGSGGGGGNLSYVAGSGDPADCVGVGTGFYLNTDVGTTVNAWWSCKDAAATPRNMLDTSGTGPYYIIVSTGAVCTAVPAGGEICFGASSANKNFIARNEDGTYSAMVQAQTCTGTGRVISTALDGTVLCSFSPRGITGQWGDLNSATVLTASTTMASCDVAPVTGTIVGWSAQVSPGGASATFKLWKNASATALPSVADSINTAGIGISANTVVKSTTLTDFTTVAVTAGDNVCVNLSAVSGSPTYAAVRVNYQ